MTLAEITWFEPQPRADEVPLWVASPFAHGPPVGLARRAAEELQARLRAGAPLDGLDPAVLDLPNGGKMFGVLVVADARGQVGYLSAFSGMLGGRWQVGGFAPPLFDREARDRFWPAGEAELGELEHALAETRDGSSARELRARQAALASRHADELAGLRERHARARRERRAERARITGAPGDARDPDHQQALLDLDQASRGDTAERRRLDAAQSAERADLLALVNALDERIAALERLRAARSNHYLERILETYVITSARGERRSLPALFAPRPTPGGAGDCAAPKLLGRAYQLGLRPLALAELWWGASPATGDRRAGQYYPACRGKCGVILPFMLEGLATEPAPVFGGGAIADDEPRLLHEDRWLIVVDKPCGLLSVPGRHARLQDSVLTRLRRRYPDATGPLVVHRLDLDTSGVLVAARDADTHAALQRLFARREVDKRYVAWLDGPVAGDGGVVELALRVDHDDRPRQLHDPVHGDPALTTWSVLARTASTTRVALHPRTGRTHQLRVHAAHPLGIGVPIVGDRLYGHADDGQRLMLHAEAISFTHPRTGELLQVTSPAPF